MAAAWIPIDPDTYLDSNIHTQPPQDWVSEYAGWRYCYAPAFKRLSQVLLPGTSCANLQQVLRPIVPIAVALIPDALKQAAPNSLKTDWTLLPDDQIRSAWDRVNMMFSKIVLCTVSLQILSFIQKGHAGAGIAADTLPLDVKPVIERLEQLPAQSAEIVAGTHVQLATSRFINHDRQWWNSEVVTKQPRSTTFKQVTLQSQTSFLQSFSDGALATVATLRAIKVWHDKEFPKHILGPIEHYIPDPKRITAAKRETVRELMPAGSGRR